MTSSASATLDVQETRRKILEAAARLFAEQGFESTSLSQVAREAGVSKALIFWHFDNKDKLYRSSLRKTLEPYFIDVDDLEGLGEREQIARLVDLFYDFVNENVYSVRFFLNLTLRYEQPQDEGLRRVHELYVVFRNSSADIINTGKTRGTFGPQVDSQREAALIMATLAGVLVQQFMVGELHEHAKDVIDYLKVTLFQRLSA